MSRYHHNKVTHELEPIAGFGSRVATSIDGKTLTVHSSILNIDGYNYGEGDIGAAINMMATIESGMIATKNYSAGECFVYNAILYVVTQDVSEGANFVIGTNCALAPNLTDQINLLVYPKTAAITKTTSAVGTFNVTASDFPSDFHRILGVKGSNQSGTYYIVKYHEFMYGLFKYLSPHEPLASGEATVTFYYV